MTTKHPKESKPTIMVLVQGAGTNARLAIPTGGVFPAYDGVATTITFQLSGNDNGWQFPVPASNPTTLDGTALKWTANGPPAAQITDISCTPQQLQFTYTPDAETPSSYGYTISAVSSSSTEISTPAQTITDTVPRVCQIVVSSTAGSNNGTATPETVDVSNPVTLQYELTTAGHVFQGDTSSSTLAEIGFAFNSNPPDQAQWGQVQWSNGNQVSFKYVPNPRGGQPVDRTYTITLKSTMHGPDLSVDPTIKDSSVGLAT
jgi:hypothetical protein